MPELSYCPEVPSKGHLGTDEGLVVADAVGHNLSVGCSGGDKRHLVGRI